MANADGAAQEPGGRQLPGPDGPQVPAAGQQISQDAYDSLSQDGRQEEPAGSALAVPHDLQVPGGGQLAVKKQPECFTIGTQKAFQKNRACSYEQRIIDAETIYVCNQRSRWALADEFLVLRCEHGIWTAYDSALSADKSILQCRQAVFRCRTTNITQEGWHEWETNADADSRGAGVAPNWQGGLLAETRVP